MLAHRGCRVSSLRDYLKHWLDISPRATGLDGGAARVWTLWLPQSIPTWIVWWFSYHPQQNNRTKPTTKNELEHWISVQNYLENPAAFSRPNETKQCNRTKLLLIFRMTDSLCIQIGSLSLKMLASKSAWLHNILAKRKKQNKNLPSWHMSRNEILKIIAWEDFKKCFEENKYSNKSTLYPLVIKNGNYLCKIQYCTNNKKHQRLNRFCICNAATGSIISRQLSFVNQQMFHRWSCDV